MKTLIPNGIAALPLEIALDHSLKYEDSASALKQLRFELPKTYPCRESLSPTYSLPPSYSWHIASTLIAHHLAPEASRDTLFLFYHRLNSELSPVPSARILASAAAEHGFTRIITHPETLKTVSDVTDLPIYAITHLEELPQVLKGLAEPSQPSPSPPQDSNFDFSDIAGLTPELIRALTVSLIGKHPTLLWGPPGSAKSMIARRLPAAQPDLTPAELEELNLVHGTFNFSTTSHRPFRAPHHTISEVGLRGGGRSQKRPGELSIATHGVLYLDELPEFRRGCVETIIRALSTKRISLPNAPRFELPDAVFPADFHLIAATNPCPCGYANTNHLRKCTCSPESLSRFRARLQNSIPFHIHLPLPLASLDVIQSRDPRTTTASIRHNVTQAIAFRQHPERESISALSQHQENSQEILALARSIADLDQSPTIAHDHIHEARVLNQPPKEQY